VYSCSVFSDVVEERGIGAFAGFFRGVLEKWSAKRGVFVVRM
jgi:hypothetical protein